MGNTIKSINLDLILEGSGIKPTIPNNKYAVFGDSDFDSTINLMIGQKAYNVTDDIWYYRSKTGIRILPAITGVYKLTIYDPTGTYIMHGSPSGYYNVGDKINLPNVYNSWNSYTQWVDRNNVPLDRNKVPLDIINKVPLDIINDNGYFILTMPAQDVNLIPTMPAQDVHY
jgi:hypothetical protein